MKVELVYLITNTVTGECYVGITRQLERRWATHRKAQGAAPLAVAIREHGLESFRFEVVQQFDERVAAARAERFWIWYLRRVAGVDLYNRTSGGQDGFIHPPLSEEHRRKLSVARKRQGRQPWTQETRKKIALANRNRSANTRRKLSDAARRRQPMSASSREKCREAAFKRWHPNQEVNGDSVVAPIRT